MRIIVDVRCLMDGRRTGVEQYTLNLLLALLEMDTKNEYVLFFNSAKPPRFDFSIFEKYPNAKIKQFRIPNKILNLSFWYLGWPHIDKMVGGADVVFLPNIIFYGVSKYARLLLTIHDLSFERYPKHFGWKRRLWHTFINPRKICRRSDNIIAVSVSTKKDIASLYNINPEKITVIHSAADDKFSVINRNDENLIKVKEKYQLPYKFVLYLGTIEPRKNIIGLIRAFDRLQIEAHKTGNEEIQKYALVIAGSRGWMSEKIYKERKQARFKKHIQMIKYVREKDKRYLYNLASLFVYPSFFEGFGFPPLEAMKCGVPVIVSNNSSLPEVVGGAGIMVDPDKPDEIYQAMKEAILNRELRETLIKKGLEKAKEFNWKKTAREFLSALQKMV